MTGRRRGSPPRGASRVTRSRSQVYEHGISDLPDDLLRRILARLGCLSAAARAGVLSRQWRGLWTGLDEVAIRGLEPDAVHAALAKLTCPVLKTLDIDTDIDISTLRRRRRRRRQAPADDVASLLHAAARLSPGKLAVTIRGPSYDDDDIAVDLSRLSSSTAIKLDVPDVFFVLPPATEFPELETLSLSGCTMDLTTLVPRCPKLRVLSVIKPPSSLDEIEVHSATLQELAVTTLDECDVEIAASALKKLTLTCDMGMCGSLSVVAPMVEEVTLKCWYYSMYVELCGMWRICLLGIRPMGSKEQGKLTNGDEGSSSSSSSAGVQQHQTPRAHVLCLQILVNNRGLSERNFAEEMEGIPVPLVSALELTISTMGHVFGPMMLHLLGIYTAVQKLSMVLLAYEGSVADTCFRRRCHCEELNEDWRDELISLTSLTEVEINGFRGDYDEVDFVGLLFRCAPMLLTVTVKVSDDVIPGQDWYNGLLDTFQQYPSVNSSLNL